LTNENSNSPELIIAIVAPVGTRRKPLHSKLKDALSLVGYNIIDIKLSELLKQSTLWADNKDTDYAKHIERLQATGNEFREKLVDGAALARAAITAIRDHRAKITGSPDKPAGRIAYVLDQLKNPSEVNLLREVYGSCFFLIAAHAPKKKRTEDLAAMIAQSAGNTGEANLFRAEADTLIQRDEIQEGDFGQNTRDTYPKADFFVNLGLQGGETQVERFVELLFGHPFRTPSREEYAMYQASAASLRSSDDMRQVGAAIATNSGDVVAVGTNEVPFRNGGLYWSDASPDARDQALDEDRAAGIKASVLVELLTRMSAEKWLVENIMNKPMLDLAKSILPNLKGTKFMNIGEFGRTVHAEMASLIDAARRGVSIDKLTMYVTTFPCHNCAKHIIAAGIRKVVYLEPYPKSKADFLYNEEIELDAIGQNYGDKVAFVAFSGIAPRQYQQFFAVADCGGIKRFSQKEWNSKRMSLLPRWVLRNAYHAYMVAERQELEKLPESVFKWDRKTLCP
jgi:cytidine deaminase